MAERVGSMPGFFPSTQLQSSHILDKDKHPAPEIAAHSADDLDCHVPTPAAEPASIQPSPAIRKSRTVKPPSWLQSFVHASLPSHNVSSSSCQYLLSAYMSYANIVVPHYQFICAYSSIKESTTYVEAA
ncbi:hypothetical protein KY289_002092 [Solanum tuberosum]|nr:hypothetical protein KY289_002092 [Solanum tuberosum]